MSSAKRPVDVEAITSDAKVSRTGEAGALRAAVCCSECGRKYAGPLDLPPVVITRITKTMPDKVERSRGYCFTSNGERSFNWFLSRLSESDQIKVRELCATQLKDPQQHRVDVTTASGDAATCVIEPEDDRRREDEGSQRYRLELFVDLAPHISATINAANVDKTFMVDSTPISIRDVWGVPLDRLFAVEKDFLWLHNLATRHDAYYLGICRLEFATSTSGHFELALIGDGPNMGSAGGPTVQYLAPLYRIEFAWPEARPSG